MDDPTRSDYTRSEREWLEGLRYEDKFPDEEAIMDERDAREREVEAVARALWPDERTQGTVGWDAACRAAGRAIAALDRVRGER